MDNCYEMEHMLKKELKTYIAMRRDDFLKKDSVYMFQVGTYTEAMEAYEKLELSHESKEIIEKYINVIIDMDERCEYACYFAGVTDMLALKKLAGGGQDGESEEIPCHL